MPDLAGILERLEPTLGPLSGEPVPLDGGITNHNYRVRFGERDCVVRFPGKDTDQLGIDREAEWLAASEAARLGIGPALIHADAHCAVTAFVDARPIDPEALWADPAAVARALRSFHDSPLELPSRFWVPELLAQYAGLVTQAGRALPSAYERTQALVERIAARLPLSDPVPCHNDLLAGNLLVGAGGVMLVDWEYAGMGHHLFDLGNLAVNNDFDAPAEDRLLGAYFGAPPSDGRRAALALMRIMSDAREAAWGVIQSVISELDFDFDAYASKHFERLHAKASEPAFDEWLASARP
jgi:thiamine kinase-like enzyme